MCGIAGYNWNDKELMPKMLKIMNYRGPDDNGTYSDNGLTLGHLRLSIIDLSRRGRQPMANREGNLVITFNGEIFNHKELRKELEEKGYKFNSDTDTEVIINAYDEYGPECLKKFNGQFSFVIYDADKKLLFGARDRIGIKPMYYYKKGKKFIFASELKSILVNDVSRDINPDALNRFVSMRYISGEGTIIKGIKRLMAGHYFTYDIKSNKFNIQKYWDLEYNVQNKSKKYFINGVRQQLKESIERRMMSDVPLGVYLSGGLDSSSIVGVMNEFTDNIKTFSVGFGYGGEVDELRHAKIVSDHFNTDHKEIIVKSNLVKNLPRVIWHGDEPLADPASLPGFLLSEQATKDVSVVLSGEGADEMFGGYEQNKFLLQRNKLKLIPKPLRAAGSKSVDFVPEKGLNYFFAFASNIGKEGRKRFQNYITNIDDKSKAYFEIMGIFNDKERHDLLTPEFLKQIKQYTQSDRINKTYYGDKKPYLNQILRYEVKEPLPENLLMKADKTTMPFSIEGRVPFLDHKLAEFAATIPPNLKLNKIKNEKYILKEAMRPYLPESIIRRKKHRFYVPIDLWRQKEDIKGMFDKVLNKQEVNRQGFFDYSTINKIQKNYETSPLFYARQLWTLLNFQIWHKMFIEEDAIKTGKLPKIF